MEGVMPTFEYLITNYRRLRPAGHSLLLRLIAERAHALRAEYLRGVWRRFRAWQRRKAAIAQLRSLDDSALKDIGLHRSGIEAAVNESTIVAAVPRRAFPQKPHLCLQRTG
jgi:uncharacterized protein YjiS (DUF1127 family)